MRRNVALLQVVMVGILLNISSLVACPMLQPEKTHSCCSRPEPLKKCPIAPTMDLCPLNVTEAKFGVVNINVASIPPLIAADTLFERPNAATDWRSPLLDTFALSRLYLANRVLRI